MRLILALCLLAAPALGQTEAPAPPGVPPAEVAPQDDDPGLIEEGARRLFRGLMSEVDPALDEMGQAMETIGPALDALGAEVGPKLRQLVTLIDDFANYDAPVILPNGDILIRRTAPPPPPAPLPTPAPDGAIDL